MKLVLSHVELVPPDEAAYIRRELALAHDGANSDRLKKVIGRRYYTAAILRDAVANGGARSRSGEARDGARGRGEPSDRDTLRSKTFGEHCKPVLE